MWHTTRALAVAFTALGVCICLGCSVERENDLVSVAGQAGPCDEKDRVILVVECEEGGDLYCDGSKVAVLFTPSTDISGICGSTSGFSFNVVVKGPAVLMAYYEASFEDFPLEFQLVVKDDPATAGVEKAPVFTGAVFEVSAPAEVLVTVQ